MTTIRRARVHGGPRMSCQITDVDSNANLTTMTGRACPYNAWASRGWFLLAFADGCFDKSIKESARALPLLLFHDAESFPIGHATNWDSRADGLWGEWSLEDDPRAQRAARLAQSGALTGLSVSWMPLLQDWEISDLEEWNIDDTSTLDRCTLREGRLVETSMTPIPNFEEAGVAHIAARRDTPTAHSSLTDWKAWRATLSG